MDAPYGTRTRISTCVSIGLTDPHMYLAYCKTEFSLSRRRLNSFTARLDTAQERTELPDIRYLIPFIWWFAMIRATKKTSIHTLMTLPSGHKIRTLFLHPAPPSQQKTKNLEKHAKKGFRFEHQMMTALKSILWFMVPDGYQIWIP